jgi:hypothetical protein
MRRASLIVINCNKHSSLDHLVHSLLSRSLRSLCSMHAAPTRYLIPLLSGQNVNMVTGVLSLKPHYPPPYVLPVLIMNCEAALAASVDSDAGGKTLFVVPAHMLLGCPHAAASLGCPHAAASLGCPHAAASLGCPHSASSLGFSEQALAACFHACAACYS